LLLAFGFHRAFQKSFMRAQPGPPGWREQTVTGAADRKLQTLG